uniref:MADS-box domain-containing protein n=1 Tax=Caenorhabditis tropicalis TaxID=1561998 RepID=A0A1I7UM52_9PELO
MGTKTRRKRSRKNMQMAVECNERLLLLNASSSSSDRRSPRGCLCVCAWHQRAPIRTRPLSASVMEWQKYGCNHEKMPIDVRMVMMSG